MIAHVPHLPEPRATTRSLPAAWSVKAIGFVLPFILLMTASSLANPFLPLAERFFAVFGLSFAAVALAVVWGFAKVRLRKLVSRPNRSRHSLAGALAGILAAAGMIIWLWVGVTELEDAFLPAKLGET